VLIVEDEWAIASMIESIVSQAGYGIAGPVGRLDEAVDLARSEPLSAALLDVDLGSGVDTFPLAAMLRKRGVPFAFVSGRSPEERDAAFATVPWVPKPFHPEALKSTLRKLVRAPMPDAD
jgi:DNA-binding response OmpR family regulator